MAGQSGSGRNAESDRPISIGAEDARQGRIVLTTRRRRIVFVSGLVGGVVLALVVAVLAG